MADKEMITLSEEGFKKLETLMENPPPFNPRMQEALKNAQQDSFFVAVKHGRRPAGPRVFLGGTCNDSKWREQLIPMLDAIGFAHFNPVVPDWTPECQKEELRQRCAECSIVLYVLTPKMSGVYSIAEVVDDSNKRPLKTVLCILSHDDLDSWTEAQVRSMQAVADLVKRNGAAVFYNLESVVEHLKITKFMR